MASKPCVKASLMIIIGLFLTLVFVSQLPHGDAVDDNTPMIVWWNELFPHVTTPGNEKGIYKVSCPKNGYTCVATQNREILTDESHRLMTVLMYGTDFRAYEAPLPRKPNHLWALLHEESPQNNHMLCHMEALSAFNFSSTFKRQSDYPITTQHFPSLKYLLERKPIPLEQKNRYRKEGLAPVVYLQSHCDVPSDRDRYIYHLMGNISIDSYGACLNNKQFGDPELSNTEKMADEKLYDVLAKYKFHVAFENAICDDYITEKFVRPLHLGSVPIYKGSPSARDWAPSTRSVIMADDFESPETLAEFINYLDENDDAYLKYLEYKQHNSVSNVLLRQTLANRTWSTDGVDQPSFVEGFECFLCEQMHKIKQAADSGTRLAPKIVPHSHLDCPPPEPSFGTIADIPPNSHFHNWVEDYWQSVDQAAALRDMLREQASDPDELWTYIEKRYHAGHGALQHTEL